MKKMGNRWTKQKSLFTLCLMVVNFAFTPLLYFLVVPKASLKDGVFNSSYHVPKTLFLSLS